MRAIDRKLVRDLRRIRGQAIAIGLVIAAGIALYVLMLSAFDSLVVTQQAYYARNRFADVFASLVRAPESLAADIRRIPGVAVVETRVVADVTLDVPGVEAPVTGRLVSAPERGRPVLNDVTLTAGRYLEPDRPDEVLASAKFARANHLGPGDTLGALINGRRRDLRIVGLALSPEYVYAIRPGELVADDARFGILWMTRRALASAFRMDGAFNDVSLALAPGASAGEVISRLDLLLDPYGGAGAVPRARQLSNFFLQSEIDSLQGIGRVVPILFLLVAAFLLHIVLGRIVTLERQEIGVLKALGYGDARVAWHYVELSLLVGMAGGAAGVAAGAWMGRGMTALYTQFFQFPLLRYRLEARLVAEALVIAAAAAGLSALGAARRILRLAPAEAMKPEPPAAYRVGWFARPLLRRIVSPATRVILRNVQRHPLRAALSTLGIASGGAIMIVGLFTIDSVDVALDVQFGLAQLWDVVVTFTDPASAGAAEEVARLPGVLQAEPLRMAAARFRAGPRSRYVGITGLPAPSPLNRVVDASLGVVELPPDGLVLSRKLADLLHVGPGETITVDILEGARPVRQVPVAGLVEEFIGTNAYMRIDALHRLLQEGRTLSGAYLRVDRLARDALYRALKATPRVAGVGLKSAALESYRQTLAQSIGIVRTVTVIIALIMAFGVVYNTSRIALSERARELGTLRVIGFSRGEVAYVLMGELALITLAALPLGVLLGYGLAGESIRAYDTEVYRIPLVVTPRTILASLGTVTVATIVSGWLVRRRLDRLDLIAVLKTRE